MSDKKPADKEEVMRVFMAQYQARQAKKRKAIKAEQEQQP